MRKVSLLFPGQGSQYVGMGMSFLATDLGKETFALADKTLQFSLSSVMEQGPIEALTKTDMAQPAILLHSILAFYALREQGLSITLGIGHSLGEYSALVAAGVLSLTDALKIVQRRGQLMANACPPNEGAMAAVLGMDKDKILLQLEPFADAKNPLYTVVANLNSADQTVIAGTKEGVHHAASVLKEQGAKRVIMLAVSAPFHCALMASAQDGLRNYLDEFTFNDPIFPIMSNVSAQIMTNGDEIKDLMIKQVTSPVRFHECVLNALENNLFADVIIELGPKTVLSGLFRKISPSAHSVFNLDTIEDLSTIKEQLNV